jgi:hypothetical protein
VEIGGAEGRPAAHRVAAATRTRILSPAEGPPPPALLGRGAGDLEALIALDHAFQDRPDVVFGLEARAAFHLTAHFEDPTQPHIRTLLLRPASEPTTFSYWDRFRTWAVDDASMIELASCLLGRPTAYRTTACGTPPDPQGYSQAFPKPEVARTWLSSAPPPRERVAPDEAFSSALVWLAAAVLHHPLPDGNGRLGRALFQGALARSSGLSCPLLPLGPYTYASGREAMAAWIALGHRGDWRPLVALYEKILAEILQLHRQLALSARPHPSPTPNPGDERA